MSANDYEIARSQAKRQYQNACTTRAAYRRQENECRAAQSAVKNNLVTCQIKKLNFEKRIQDIQKAIKKIEDMDRSISESANWAKKTDEAYAHCMKCDGHVSASFDKTFHVKSVNEDQNLQDAINKLRNEWHRLEQELIALRKTIAQNEQEINNLQKKIGSCVAQAASCSAKMATMSYQISLCNVQLRRLS